MEKGIDLDKLVLTDTSKGDSRTSGGSPSLDEVYSATKTHIKDIRELMELMSNILHIKGLRHDWTKLNNFEDEYGYLVTHDVRDDEFLESNWWWKHIRMERHHLNDYCPSDVNLFDVLEMIADRVVAEKGRTGEINNNYLKLDVSILIRAYWNTIILMDELTLKEEVDSE